MDLAVLLSTPIGFLPVIVFLVALRYMDSYQLVSVRYIATVIVAGGISAVASYFVNTALLNFFGLDFQLLTRYIAPVVEECLKGSIIIWLLYRHRIGFLVDAAITGFAVGAGFALVENFYYLQQGLIQNPGVWIVRGFGTALMHGGVTAIFAIISQTLTERSMTINPILFLPGLLAGAVLHSGFNHFFLTPLLHTALVVVILPPIMYVVFERSAASLHSWLQLDFDEDANILAQINSGEFTDSKMGRFLTELQDKFEGPVVVDMFCYLRLYTELALRAKGILMMREHGIEPPIEEDVKAMLEELKFLEDSIGKVGVITLQPFLHFTRKDLWQMYVLES
jgi:RsiW-degrading membrane proteinase PrsW (M82 family)